MRLEGRDLTISDLTKFMEEYILRTSVKSWMKQSSRY